MATEQMTPRERWMAVLKREPTDRVPTDYWATPEATKKLLDHLDLQNHSQLYERLHIDRVVAVSGRYVGPPISPELDVFGCGYRDVAYATGSYRECVFHPLAEFETVSQIDSEYRWPSPDWWNYTHIPAQTDQLPDCPVRGGGSEPFLTYCHLRGQEQALMDLVLHPDIVHYCLDRLFDLCYKSTERIFDQIPGRVLFSYVAEDLGTQQSLLMSRSHMHEFLLPRMKRMMDLVHDAGAYVFHHSDGAVREVIPDMIEIGMDVLNPVQWRCEGMEREALKRDFGDQIVFHGAMDNQYTLPFGTVDEVRQEVLDNLATLGCGGGYILAPCHNIQAVSPPENIVAMYDTAYEAIHV